MKLSVAVLCDEPDCDSVEPAVGTQEDDKTVIVDQLPTGWTIVNGEYFCPEHS